MKSSKSVKSKQLLLSGLVALVLIAGYYRWTVDTNEAAVPVVNEVLPEETGDDSVAKIELDSEPEVENSEISDNAAEEMDYFEKSKYDRDLARSESVAMLQEIADENSSDEKRSEAESKISDAAVRSEKESTIENLIISKGFKDCVVFMDDDVISVVVKSDKLEGKSVNQIKDIIIGQTDFKASQIRISSKAE